MRFLAYPKNVHTLIARAIRREAATRHGDAERHDAIAWLSALQLINPEITGYLDPQLSLDDEAQLVDFLQEADQLEIPRFNKAAA
jgi:hypothetical protein